MIEARRLVRREAGWVSIPYVWNEAQPEAALERTGADVPLQRVAAGGGREDFVYEVPDQNQCAGCHASNNTTREILPLGPKARHLNKDYDYADGREPASAPAAHRLPAGRAGRRRAAQRGL